MARLGSRYERFVYALVLDSTIYVGITAKPFLRKLQHARYGRPEIQKLIEKGASLVLLSGLLPCVDAAQKEREAIAEYQSRGYWVLNKRRGGALGGNSVRWTLARVTEEAKLYRPRSEFRDKSAGAYAAARMGGFLDTVCKHMPTPPEWDRSKVLAVAARCSSRRQFKLDHQKA